MRLFILLIMWSKQFFSQFGLRIVPRAFSKSFSRTSVVGAAMDSAVNLFVPPLCGICQSELSTPGLCVACYLDMQAIADPFCNRCGLPLPYALPDDLCGNCLTNPPPLRHIRAAYRYNQASRSLLLPFKHGGQIHQAATLSRLMMGAFTSLVTDAHLVVPIPLHWSRLLKRRYNQSAEISRRLCHLLPPNHSEGNNENLVFAPHYLRRTRRTALLRGKSLHQRRALLKGAFHLPDKLKAQIQGRPILLVDDVMTTGATLFEAARTLSKAGAGPIDALVFARVI